MRFWKRLLPHLCAAAHAALAIVVILDAFNPALGLLRGAPFLLLAAVCVETAVESSVRTLLRRHRNSR